MDFFSELLKTDETIHDENSQFVITFYLYLFI